LQLEGRKIKKISLWWFFRESAVNTSSLVCSIQAYLRYSSICDIIHFYKHTLTYGIDAGLKEKSRKIRIKTCGPRGIGEGSGRGRLRHSNNGLWSNRDKRSRDEEARTWCFTAPSSATGCSASANSDSLMKRIIRSLLCMRWNPSPGEPSFDLRAIFWASPPVVNLLIAL
jgi:hypothetical protein